MTATESTGTGSTDTALSQERADLLAALAHARHFLRFTARDLTDEQANTRSTVSELTVGGLIKHVTQVERNWAQFTVRGAEAMQVSDYTTWTEDDFAEYAEGFRLSDGETLAGVLADYDEAARETDRVLRDAPSLDTLIELPKAPWNTDTHWSARRVFQHICAETAQHAGHADIIRESLDGAKSMG
ncbi:DinB family protein [Microlunatus elymi]|uniref:DinB family protein n=1 Tax=Microlunatus elymi TaxID=2596828 RepID=A0A516Q278_9ACTN|nr:DinB family protein [Microlunatus elymi]QDP97526.1 DinB family protein [Microlunatus elymi]